MAVKDCCNCLHCSWTTLSMNQTRREWWLQVEREIVNYSYWQVQEKETRLTNDSAVGQTGAVHRQQQKAATYWQHELKQIHFISVKWVIHATLTGRASVVCLCEKKIKWNRWYEKTEEIKEVGKKVMVILSAFSCPCVNVCERVWREWNDHRLNIFLIFTEFCPLMSLISACCSQTLSTCHSSCT